MCICLLVYRCSKLSPAEIDKHGSLPCLCYYSLEHTLVWDNMHVCTCIWILSDPCFHNSLLLWDDGLIGYMQQSLRHCPIYNDGLNYHEDIWNSQPESRLLNPKSYQNGAWTWTLVTILYTSRICGIFRFFHGLKLRQVMFYIQSCIPNIKTHNQL